MTSSNYLLSPKEIEFLKPYKESLSKPYSENHKVQEDISEDTTCSKEKATFIAKPHINEESTINDSVTNTNCVSRASTTAVLQADKDNIKLNAYVRLKINVEKADKIYVTPLHPVPCNKPSDDTVYDSNYWLGIISTQNSEKITGKNIHTFLDKTKPVHQEHHMIKHHVIIGKTPKDLTRILCKLSPLLKEGVDITLKRCVPGTLAKGIIAGTVDIQSMPNYSFHCARKQESSS